MPRKLLLDLFVTLGVLGVQLIEGDGFPLTHVQRGKEWYWAKSKPSPRAVQSAANPTVYREPDLWDFPALAANVLFGVATVFAAVFVATEFDRRVRGALVD